MSEATSRAADYKFWSNYLVPRFQAYLRETGSYNAEQESDHVKFYDSLLPILGPKLPHPHTSALLCMSQRMPVDFSLNLCDSRPPIVRFEMEPLDALSGSENDPFAQECVAGSFSAIAAGMTTPVDKRWSEQLQNTFRLDDAEKKTARAKMPPHMDRVSQGIFGISLDGGNRSMKFCTSHWPKFLGSTANVMGTKETAQNSDSFVFDVVRRLEPGGAALSPPLGFLQHYFNDEKSVNPPSPILFMMLDCIQPTKARVKLYGRTSSNAFQTVKDIMTFGGRLTDEDTMEGLRRLRSIWHLLLNDEKVRDNENYNRPVLDPASYRNGLMVSFEVCAANDKPEVKIYVPFWQYHENDLVSIRNLEQVFRTLGWDWCNGKYEALIRNAFDGDDLSKRQVHDYVSFNYSKRQGSYMTMYHAPAAPGSDL